ncbi:MAG TPA: putative zinc-binding protein [Smithellaceae bacterium]|nr:putative zinc-binding protein [Smithellaceae bacterium]HRS89116.1 putative zinc-binding protein [Smithellaceae bacterium]HRV25990.1 putative zinc-binding protein [Smithellaceae bacterium]
MSDCCEGGTKLIYSCAGSADVGEIADRVARKMRDEGHAIMTCLAGVGAGLSGFVQSAIGADENITIDGCSTACARKSLERIGVSPKSYILTNLGLEKHETPVTEKVIDEIYKKIINGGGFLATTIPETTYSCCGMKILKK